MSRTASPDVARLQADAIAAQATNAVARRMCTAANAVAHLGATPALVAVALTETMGSAGAARQYLADLAEGVNRALLSVARCLDQADHESRNTPRTPS